MPTRRNESSRPRPCKDVVEPASLRVREVTPQLEFARVLAPHERIVQRIDSENPAVGGAEARAFPAGWVLSASVGAALASECELAIACCVTERGAGVGKSARPPHGPLPGDGQRGL